MKTLVVLGAAALGACDVPASGRAPPAVAEYPAAYRNNPEFLPVFSDRAPSGIPSLRAYPWKREDGGRELTCRLRSEFTDLGGEQVLSVTVPALGEYEHGYANAGWWGFGFHINEGAVDARGYRYFVLSVRHINYESDFEVGFGYRVGDRSVRASFQILRQQLKKNAWRRFVFAIPPEHAAHLDRVDMPFFALDTVDARGGTVQFKDVYFARRAPQEPAAASLPAPDRMRLLIGQDVASINRYLADVSPKPWGMMAYVTVQQMRGLREPFSELLGQPDPNQVLHADALMGHPHWKPQAVNLGLMIRDLDKFFRGGGVDRRIVKGAYDAKLESLRRWIAEAKVPVYLRIGYEFDSIMNGYEPSDYVEAYRYIAHKLSAPRPKNLVLVWHSWTAPTFKGYHRFAWYPGDAWVDLFGISLFAHFSGSHTGVGTVDDINHVLQMARMRGKPVMIAEAAPFGGIRDDAWETWFEPVLELMAENDIRLLSYINADWESQSLWRGQGWGDTRIQRHARTRERWEAQLRRGEVSRP